jgi:hypothetical protein
MTTARLSRPAIVALYAGLTLTVGTLLVLYADHSGTNVLAAHIRVGYPTYDDARISSAATTYVIYLSVLGALGAIGWLATIWAAGTRRRWARWVAAGLFVVGTSIALFNLLVTDTSGDTGLPPLLGWLGLLPCLAGLVAVVALWRKPSLEAVGKTPPRLG